MKQKKSPDFLPNRMNFGFISADSVIYHDPYQDMDES